MNLMLELYLINVLKNLDTLAILLLFICITIAIGALLIHSDNGFDSLWDIVKKYRLNFILLLVVGMTSLFLIIAIPSEKTMYLILGTESIAKLKEQNAAIKQKCADYEWTLRWLKDGIESDRK